jgi:hypothetical protein
VSGHCKTGCERMSRPHLDAAQFEQCRVGCQGCKDGGLDDVLVPTELRLGLARGHIPYSCGLQRAYRGQHTAHIAGGLVVGIPGHSSS